MTENIPTKGDFEYDSLSTMKQFGIDIDVFEKEELILKFPEWLVLVFI